MENELQNLVKKEVEKQLEAKITDYLVPRAIAAKILEVDKSTLWRWEKNHYLIPVRIGKKVFYSAELLKKKFCLTSLTIFHGK